MRHFVTYNRFDIVKVPFPFTDKQATKTRPALVLSSRDAFNEKVGHSVMAMITSAKHSAWALDTVIDDLATAGLPSPSRIRLKLFTLDERLVIAKLGELAKGDQARFETHFKQLFAQ
jgi:mRNA interferase MazF